MNAEPIFSAEELERRRHAVAERLPDVDVVVASSFANSYYLSGLPVLQWGRWAVTVVGADGEAALVAPEQERAAAAAYSPLRDVRCYTDDGGPSADAATALIAEILRERGARRIGIEGLSLPSGLASRLSSALPEAKLVDVGAELDDVRLVSSDEEVAYLREASRIADAGLGAVIARLEPGVTELELALEARMAMERELRSGLTGSVNCYMQQGEWSIVSHARATRRPIEPGLLVEVVCEAEIWHYLAAVERCVLVGRTPTATERAYAVMLEAFHASRDAVTPGATCAEVHEAAARIFAREGYACGSSGLARNVTHHWGGRIESGNLRAYNRRVLEPGIVLSVEPCTFVAGVGAPRHCDMVVVTDGGREVLSAVDDGTIRIAV